MLFREENKKSQEQTKSDVPPVSFLKLVRIYIYLIL